MDLKAADLLVDAAHFLSDQLIVVQGSVLRLLAEPEPLADLRHQAGHGQTLPSDRFAKTGLKALGLGRPVPCRTRRSDQAPGRPRTV